MAYIPVVEFQKEGSEGKPNRLTLYQHSFNKQADAFEFVKERLEHVCQEGMTFRVFVTSVGK